MIPLTEDIAIVGSGRMGTALLEGFRAAKRRAEIAPKEREASRALVQASGIVVLAVPFTARRDVVDTLGDALDGKIVVDVTNPLKFPGPELDRGSESGAEELQRWLPRASVVKAFNTVFSPSMPTGTLHGTPLSAFVATDDARAKEVVLRLAREVGFDAVDAGPLAVADDLERLLLFEMRLLKIHGSAIGWRLVRAPSA